MNPEANPTRPGPTRPAIQRALRDLLETTGADVSVDPGELLRRTRPARTPGAPAVHWMAAAARQAGLRASIVQLTIRAALEQQPSGQPLVARVGGREGSGRWVSITRLGRKLDVKLFGELGEESQARVSRRALPGLLRTGPDEVLSWLTAENVAPCAPAASDPSASAPVGPFERLMRLLQPDRGEIWTIVVFAVATGVLMLATPIAVQALVNFVAFGGAIPPLVVVALLLLLGLGFAAALTATQTWIVEILQRRIFVRMVADLAERLPRVTLAARGHGYGPELVNRFFDIVTIQKVGSALLLDGLGVLLSVLVGLAILAFYHPLLLAFDILLLVVIAGLVLGPVRSGIASAIKESKAKYSVAAWLEEIARNPLAFKTAGAQQWVFDECDRLARGYVESRRSHYRVVFGQVVGGLTLQVLASTALLTLGGLLVIRGSLTLGQLVAAELIVTMVVSSVAKMGKHLEGFYDLMAAVDKVGQLLDLPTESLVGELPPAPSGPASLTLDGVRWPSPERQLPPGGVSLELRAGGRLGLSGDSGAGKSRLMELAWGLGRPERGSIRLDGRDLRDLAPEYLRRVVSLTAGVEIVTGSLRDNVRLGRPFVSDDDVRSGLQKAGLLAALSALPDGLDTRVAPDGYPLTEGQAQALVVARAVAGHPRLLLFDGSLDQLPGAARGRLLDVLFDPGAPWTLVMTSDRPEILERCDTVLYLPEGRVERRVLATTPAS